MTHGANVCHRVARRRRAHAPSIYRGEMASASLCVTHGGGGIESPRVLLLACGELHLLLCAPSLIHYCCWHFLSSSSGPAFWWCVRLATDTSHNLTNKICRKPLWCSIINARPTAKEADTHIPIHFKMRLFNPQREHLVSSISTFGISFEQVEKKYVNKHDLRNYNWQS